MRERTASGSESAFGVIAQGTSVLGNINPWVGFRVGVIGHVG